MKKIISTTLIIIVFATFQINAQNNKGKADDQARIVLNTVIPDNIPELTSSASIFLKNKLSQIATKNGMGGTAISQRFVITANIEIITKDITPTAPPMHAYTIEVTFYIGDGISGTLFATTSKTLKGVGKNEEKAYRAALKNIKVTDPIFKSFIAEGKTKIIEYYNTKCDMIFKEADMLASKEDYDNAVTKLVEIPEVCKECYDKSMEKVESIYQKKIDKECSTLMLEANTAWNEGLNSESAQKAGTILSEINPNSKCYDEAKTLTNKIAERIKEIDQREWDFKLKQQQDAVDLENATIKAARDVAIEEAKNQPEVIYNTVGWGWW